MTKVIVGNDVIGGPSGLVWGVECGYKQRVI